MATFQKVKFKDFAKLQRGFDLPQQDRMEGKYPVVASTSVTAFHDKFKVKAPCVTTGRSGALGEVLYTNVDCWPLNTTLWVKDFCGNDPKFVYYRLKTLGLEKFNAGAGVPTLNKNHLDTLDIDVPNIQVQTRIASVLSAYDDLIENNEKRIKALEEMVQLLYAEWFVKPVKNSLPKGWEIKELGDLVENIHTSAKAGAHLAGRQYIPIENISRKSFILRESSNWEEAQSSLVLFEKNDILFGAMRPYFHKVAIASKPGVTRTTCFVLRAKEDILRPFAFSVIFSNAFISFASSNTKGATIPYSAWENSLENYRVLVPSADILIKFNKQFDSIINQIIALVSQNNILSKTRDLLIPQLVAGKRELK